MNEIDNDNEEVLKIVIKIIQSFQRREVNPVL